MRPISHKPTTVRTGFTMIELVIVIMVLGILAALAMPRLDRDVRQEAIDNILSHVRYTQHLALMDDKHLFDDPTWQQRYWKIMFGTCTGSDKFYMIGSDDDINNGSFFDRNESATDPANGKPMFWVNGQNCSDGGDNSVSPSLFITKKYGIDTFAFGGGCAGSQYIGFDHLGRPHVGFGASSIPDYSSYMKSDCTITFSSTVGSISPFTLVVQRETGHAYIVEQVDQ